MTPEQQQYVDDMRNLFSSEGWQWIVTDLNQAIIAANNLDGISTEADLHRNKGILFLARTLLNLPDDIRAIEDEEENDYAEDA